MRDAALIRTGLAGLVREAVAVDVLVGERWVAAVAACRQQHAVEQNLRGEVNGGPRALSQDGDSIAQGTGGRLSPAAAAVLRNVPASSGRGWDLGGEETELNF